MIKEVVILGAGGTARDVLSIIDDINRESQSYRCVGLLDDNPRLAGSEVQGIKVLGPIKQASHMGGVFFVNSLGSPKNFRGRGSAILKQNIPLERFETLVHPTAVVSHSSYVGRGAILFPHVVLLTNVKLGDQVIVLANTVFNHDVSVGDFTIVASGVDVSGGVRIGHECYIGSGSTLIQNISIGDRALIGMGSAVLRDVAPETVVVGNPARVLDDRK